MLTRRGRIFCTLLTLSFVSACGPSISVVREPVSVETVVPDHVVLLILDDESRRACAEGCQSPNEATHARCLSACGGERIEGTDCVPWSAKPGFACAAVHRTKTTTTMKTEPRVDAVPWLIGIMVGLVIVGIVYLAAPKGTTVGPR